MTSYYYRSNTSRFCLSTFQLSQISKYFCFIDLNFLYFLKVINILLDDLKQIEVNSISLIVFLYSILLLSTGTCGRLGDVLLYASTIQEQTQSKLVCNIFNIFILSILQEFHYERREQKRSKCFFTYIYLDFFHSHPLNLFLCYEQKGIIQTISKTIYQYFIFDTMTRFSKNCMKLKMHFNGQHYNFAQRLIIKNLSGASFYLKI